MSEVFDLMPEYREGWEVIPFPDETALAYQRIPIPCQVRHIYRGNLPKLGTLYGYGSASGKEYRIPVAALLETRPTQDGMTGLVAESVGPIYPATPFDPFLIGIEAGDPGAAAALIDHLTELHGEGRVPGRLFPDGRVSVFQYQSLEGFIDTLKKDFEHRGSRSLAPITNQIVNAFGGSRQLCTPELTRHAP